MKKLFLLPVMMFALVGCNKPAGGPQTIKFDAAEFTNASTTAGPASLEKEGLKVEFTKVTLNDWTIVKDDPTTAVKELRVNKGSDGSSTMKFSGKTVTKVEFVCQLDNGSSLYGMDGFTTEVGTLSKTTVGEQNQTGYWEGEASELILATKNHQVRIYSFTVTCK